MRMQDPKTLIFVETKRKADELTRGMRKDGWPAFCIHGDKAQSERDWVMQGEHARPLAGRIWAGDWDI